MTAMSRIAIPERMTVKSYQPAVLAHVDMSAMRWKWYWRYLWWFLHKLGAQQRDGIPESWPVQTRTIDHGNIIAMLETGGKAMRELWNLKAAILILGPDEYGKLMRDVPIEPFRFDMPVDVACAESKYEKYSADPTRTVRTRTCKLRVICVPWLSGWALLPDLDKI